RKKIWWPRRRVSAAGRWQADPGCRRVPPWLPGTGASPAAGPRWNSPPAPCPASTRRLAGVSRAAHALGTRFLAVGPRRVDEARQLKATLDRRVVHEMQLRY